MKNTIENEIKAFLIETLNDYKGGIYYACDLAYKLTESENVNGSVYCNAYKTKELIKDNFDLFGDFVRYYENELGETLNPLLEPEKAHVCFLIESCSQILQNCEFINDKWDNKIELTDKIIKILTKQINDFKELAF
jgi:hypothetical protein